MPHATFFVPGTGPVGIRFTRRAGLSLRLQHGACVVVLSVTTLAPFHSPTSAQKQNAVGGPALDVSHLRVQFPNVGWKLRPSTAGRHRRPFSQAMDRTIHLSAGDVLPRLGI